MMVEITPELKKIIAEECGKFRFSDDDCMTDEEFEDWAGCRRKSRQEIRRDNREYSRELKEIAVKERKFVFQDRLGEHSPVKLEIDSEFEMLNLGGPVKGHFKMSVGRKSSFLFYDYLLPMPIPELTDAIGLREKRKLIKIPEKVTEKFYADMQKIAESPEDETQYGFKIRVRYPRSVVFWETRKKMSKENLKPIIRVFEAIRNKDVPEVLLSEYYL